MAVARSLPPLARLNKSRGGQGHSNVRHQPQHLGIFAAWRRSGGARTGREGGGVDLGEHRENAERKESWEIIGSLPANQPLGLRARHAQGYERARPLARGPQGGMKAGYPACYEVDT